MLEASVAKLEAWVSHNMNPSAVGAAPAISPVFLSKRESRSGMSARRRIPGMHLTPMQRQGILFYNICI